jgi:hypothetical protein
MHTNGELKKMNIVNTNIATNPFLAKSDNSASSSNVKLDTELFDSIDSKAATEYGDTVNFSSKSLFMFKLIEHAQKLSDEDRKQFANALEQSGDEMFDDNFLRNIRETPTIKVEPWVDDLEKDPLLFSDLGGDTPEITIGYAGPTIIGQWNFRTLSSSSDIHETDHLTGKLDQLTSKASKELSNQDLRTITGTMNAAVEASRNYLNSSYALFRTNYDYEIAEQSISKLPMSDELKEEYSNLLSDIRSFQYQRNSDYIDELESKIQSMPQFSGIIGEEIQTLKEGVEINKELQESISHSSDGLLGVENYFQILMTNAESIERDSSDQISDMFDHFSKQLDDFDRLYIEKDWGQNSNPNLKPRNPVLDVVSQETIDLTNQYILAIDSYLANQNTSNT